MLTSPEKPIPKWLNRLARGFWHSWNIFPRIFVRHRTAGWLAGWLAGMLAGWLARVCEFIYPQLRQQECTFPKRAVLVRIGAQLRDPG